MSAVVLVVGGSGFIGRSTLPALRRHGARPVVADIGSPPDGEAFHTLDVTDPRAVAALVAEVQPSVVIHLAALLGVETAQDPRRGVEINVMGLQHVLDASVQADVERLVYGSSIAVYGDQPDWGEQSVTEADIGHPTMLYGWHKQLNEATARLYQRQFGLRCVGLRISTVYGQGRERGMSAPINTLLEGAASGVGECPFGPNTDSCLVHVEDVAEQLAILATAKQPAHDLYNSGGDFATIGDLAGWIAEMRPEAEIRLGPHDARIPHVSRVDGSRLIDEFGYRPRGFGDWARAALASTSDAPR